MANPSLSHELKANRSQQIMNCGSNFTTPLASVILPAYNASATIAETIQSVLAQDFEDFELIVINDGSTDETDNLIRSFSDHRIVYQNRSHHGLVNTLNHGIATSRGKFILRIDADDVAYRKRFSKQIAYLEQNPSVGILGTQAVAIDMSGEQIGIGRKPLGWQAVINYSRFACPVLHPTYCVRREVFIKLNGYRDLPSEDYDFLLRALEMGVQIENLPEPLIKYRVSGEGISSGNPEKMEIATRLLQKMHRNRLLGEDEQPTLDRLLALERKTSPWFRRVIGLRNRLIEESKRRNGLRGILVECEIAAISLLHPAVLRSSYRLYQARKYLPREPINLDGDE